MADEETQKKGISPLMILPPLIFAVLAVMFYFGVTRDDPDALPSTRIGRAAPVLELSQLGQIAPLTDADLRAPGVKLVNFWASWCAPCRVEHPMLEKMSEEGITIYGVNYKDDAGNALRFLEEFGNPYAAVGADGNGRTLIEWGASGVPETFIIDGNGVIRMRHAGPITSDILENTIRPAIEAASR